MSEFEVMKLFNEAFDAYLGLSSPERKRVKAWVDAREQTMRDEDKPPTTQERVKDAFRAARKKKPNGAAGNEKCVPSPEALDRVESKLPKTRGSTTKAIAKKVGFTVSYTRVCLKRLVGDSRAEALDEKTPHRWRQVQG